MDNHKKSFEKIQVPQEIDLRIEAAIRKGKKHNRNIYIRSLAGIAACLIIFVISLKVIPDKISNKYIKASTAKVAMKLPVVGSYSNLKLILNKYMIDGNQVLGISGSAVKNINSASSQDYSVTNNQVQGIDEDDSVKTDGNYIYSIALGKIIVTKAYPADEMKVVSETDTEGITPVGIFLKNKYLIVIGIKSSNEKYSTEKVPQAIDIKIGNNQTEILVYDLSNLSKLNLIKKAEVDGNYTAARMIGKYIYIISNKGLDISNAGIKDDLPYYSDSSAGNKKTTIGYDSIVYCKGAVEPNYVLVSVLDLNNINNKINVETILGSGRNIYCSNKNLYISGGSDNLNTNIYKFQLDKANVKYLSAGKVKGTILNQFSMDENNGFLRVATTEYKVNNETVNNLYILDSDMKFAGQIEGLEKGERIYAVRFMGIRAYMVTFKQTDPLLAIDLKNPSSPKVLGELKIPGFSSYIQPYDDTHIIGFGQDVQIQGPYNKPVSTGMKLALFDVSDVNDPKQMFSQMVEGKDSYSSVLGDHKALLFLKDKNLLAFPVQCYKSDKSFEYYWGAYVYNIDLANGFRLKGKISHTDNQKDELNEKYLINRILYINDAIYTLSEGCIKANDINSLKEISSVNTN